MELARLPVLALLLALSAFSADAAMYARRVKLTAKRTEDKTIGHFTDSRLQVHSVIPSDSSTRARCLKGNKELYGILNTYEAKFYVQWPCGGNFYVTFSSYKRLERHPGPIAVTGTGVSLEEVDVLTTPQNNNMHTRKKVLLQTKSYPVSMSLSKESEFSEHCVLNKTFGISQARWKAEVWAVWPCRGTFLVSYDGKYPLSPVPKPGEEQQICRLELVMTDGKDVTKQMDGEIVSVELSRKFRGHMCNESGRHFLIKDDSFTLRYQYHCVAYFKVCYKDSPRECTEVDMDNKNNKPLVKEMPGLILSLSTIKYLNKGRCQPSGRSIKDNLFTVSSTACSGTYKICYLKRIAHPINPTCPAPKEKDEECTTIKNVYGGVHLSQIVEEAHTITCVTLIKEHSDTKCNCPVTGLPKYFGRKNKIEAITGCVADFKVCYKKYMHKDHECAATMKNDDTVCVDAVLKYGYRNIVQVPNTGNPVCARMKRLLYSSTQENRCYRTVNGKEFVDFSVVNSRGKTYLFSRSKYCNGVFTLCYKPACTWPYKNVNGKCIFVEKRSSRNFVEAASKCNSIGGKLMNIKEPFLYFSKMKNNPDFKDRAFFIGGSKVFEDATRSIAVSMPKPQVTGGRTPVVHPNVPFVPIKNWHKIKELLNIQDKPHSSILQIIRRYTGYPLPQDLMRDAPYSDRCLSMDFSHEGLEFVSCHDRQHYICEQSFQNSRGAMKTPWINLDKRITYQVESLANLQKLHRAGELNLDPLTFCNKPVDIECRNAKYPDIEYSQYHVRSGQVFKPACTNNTFFCDHKDQSSKKCPDVEIRFICPPSAILTCRNVLVKDNCEKQNKDCRDTSFGPKCIEKVITHTGKELIGERVCNFNNREYTMKQCVSRGDPFVRTFDGKLINDFNSNSGSYIFFDSKSIHSGDPIPDFRVVVHNSPVKSYMGKLHSRAFDLTINGTTYSFKDGGVFEINGLKKNYMDFSDDNIDISVQSKDQTRKININTKFCMQLVWDSRMSLYLRLPQEFKTVKTGLCGNFNGDKNDDLTVDSKPLKPRAYTAYYMVASDKKACLDCVDMPKGCSKGDHAKYSSQKYCGVFNPVARNSPLYQYIFKHEISTQKQQQNFEAMKEIFNDCLENHCRIKQYDNPCHEIETHIEEVMKDLRVKDMDKLDEQIRKYTSCKAPKCSAKNSHYSAQYWVKCQATCGTANGLDDCGNHRGQGCTCDSGYYMDAQGRCITSDDCAKDCTVDLDSGESFSIKDGETVVVEACVTTVKCVKGELIESTLNQCSLNSHCGQEGTKCYCRAGYKGNGTHCAADRECRTGFRAVGDKCMRLITSPLSIWHKGAMLCGRIDTKLARYDTGADLVNLESFLTIVNKQMNYNKAKLRRINCKPNINCRIPYNEHALMAYGSKTTCPGQNPTLDKTHRYIITTSKCYGAFIVRAVRSSDYKVVTNPTWNAWVGGNTQVLGFNKRQGMAPLNVDPPRLIDPTSESDLGCYTAQLAPPGNKLVVRKNTNCMKEKYFVCEYENHLDIKKENPYDIIGLPQKVNWQEAQQKCKELGRPVLKLTSTEMVRAAWKIQATQLRGDAWIDAKFELHHPYYIFKWNSDGAPLTYSWFDKHPMPKNSKKQLTLCIYAAIKNTAKWASERCNVKKYAMCGPRKAYTPTAYSPPMPVKAASSLASVKTFIKANGLPTRVCDKPLEMKCRAKRVGDDGWVSNFDQQGHIITCTKEEISCKNNHGLDCSTLEAQFLCPQEFDQCKQLKSIHATPCDSGMMCYPTNLHYTCLCPPGLRYNPITRKCQNAKSCCSAWGDPHYTTFSGAKFDFMGDCKYLFAGSCKDSKDLNVPHFNIYTKNVECGKQGTCLSKVEIHLRNANVLRVASNVRIAQRGDYVFKINVGDNTYKMNGKEIEQTNLHVPGAFEAITKKAYFSLDTKIGLRVTLSGNRLDVYAPEKPMFELCGLCQKLAQKLGVISLINGTDHKIKYDSNRRYDYKQMAELASTFVVPDPEALDDKCDVPGEPPMPCSNAVQKELEGPKQCGVFTDDDGALKDCFDKVDPKEYFDDCKFDACAQANRTDAVCAMVKAYAQACLKKGVVLDWRNAEFCPMDCGEDEVWRAVASCEPTCGKEDSEHCSEELEEGCVCKSGLKRQADRCVPEVKCGCEVPMPDGSVWNMPLNKSILMPECTEKITCQEDSESKPVAISERFSLPQNAICHNGPPATVECSKGFEKSANGEDCERIPGGCKDGFTEWNGMCLDKPNKENIWRHAIQVCSVKDSTLAHVDTEEKLNAIAKLMVDNKLKNVFIAGRVKAVVDENRQVKLSPRVANGSIEWVNFDVSPYIMSVAVPSSDMTPATVEAAGQYLSLVVRLSQSNEPVVVAVPTTTKSTYVCEERDINPENTEWQPACNSDSNMKDEGDMEYLKNMLLNSKCSVCPVPLDVRCSPAGNQSPGQTEKGRCGLNKEGLLYSCEKGEECIDMEVSTLCAKDIDECALGLDDCGRESTCVNTVGAYKCRCLKANYPMMIDGFCQESRTCSLSGPQVKNGFNFNFTGFDNVPGVFSYDCSYLMAAPRKSSYSREMKVPYVDFALVQERTNDGLKMKMMGTIYSPKGKSPKAWMINADLLKEKMFLYGQDDQLVKNELNYISKLTSTKFIYKNPGVMMIIGLDNHYKARITMEPFSFQLEVSGQLANIMDGVCTLRPEIPGDNVFMNPKQTDDITVGIKECKPYIEPPVTPTLPTPPPPPPMRTIVPTTYGFPGGAPVEVPAMPVTNAILPVDEPGRDQVYIPTVKQFEPEPPAQSEPMTPPAPEMLPVDGDEVSIQPVPEPQPQPRCEPEAYRFCDVLAHACDIAEEQCLSALCSGEMCKCEYIIKEKFNFCNQTETLIQHLDELGCIEECDVNEIFAYSVASKQATCSDPLTLPVEGEDALDEWEFGCFCEQGFVLSGGECVRKEECGCVLDCGTYVKPYTTWRSENCTSMLRCLPGDELIEVPAPCGPNTECLETEDGYKCECEEGYFGNPEMREGCQKGKPENDGSKICYQYINTDGSLEERCNCSVGFISNCSDCEDMDECKLGLHDCDLSREKCVNVPGGYKCACTDGYRLKGDLCVDIDECKEKRDNCSRNAGCINTEGGYECECCAGYEKNEKSGLCDRDTEEFPALPKNGQCCHICNIKQICTKMPKELEINLCYLFENGDRVNFPNGQVLFKYLCLHAVDFDPRLVRPKKCEELPEVIIEPFVTARPTPRTTLPIPVRTTTYKRMIDDFTTSHPVQTPTQHSTEKYYTFPPYTKQPDAVPTRRPFPTSCDAPDLLEHLPQPPKDMSTGPVCGPLAHKEPFTHQSYAHLVRFVCRDVGGPNNLPRESFISAFSGPCPTRKPTPTFTTTTLGAPMRPRTTTLGAPMRPTMRTTTLGAPMRPRTTTLGAPMRPPQTTLPRPTERMRTVIPFITTTTTMRPPTTKPPRPPTRPMTTEPMRTTPPMRPRTTTHKIYYDTYEDIYGSGNNPNRQTVTPRTTTPKIHTLPPTTERMRTTTPRTTEPMRTTTPRTTEPMRTTTPRTTEPMRTTTFGPPIMRTTEPFMTTQGYYTTEGPFPEGICEVPPVTALDATADTPVLYEVSYSAEKVDAEFKIYGLDKGSVPHIFKPSTELESTSTFNPSELKAFIATLPRGSKMEIPNDIVKVISELNTPDKVHTYLYRSYEGLFRVIATFDVDRQRSYENILKQSSIPLALYDVTPYHGLDDLHEEDAPVIISTHMGVRIALHSEAMCGGVPPPQTTPPVKGCHSDYTGETYRHGEKWSEGDCMNCTCDQGFSACMVMDCFMMDCKHQRDVPGQCCHECLDEEPPTATPEFTPWSQWGKCFFRYGHNKCGMGYQYREREVDNTNKRVRYEPKKDEIYEERTCFEACKSEDGSVDVSKCPPESICDHLDPVCGSTVPGPTSSFKSQCNLNIQACHKGSFPIKLYAGMCDPEDDLPTNQMCERDGPIRTSVKYEYKDELEECFGPVTDIKTCASLLCKGGSNTCCKATEVEPIEVSVSCYSIKPREFLRMKKHVHHSAVKCQCQDNEN